METPETDPAVVQNLPEPISPAPAAPSPAPANVVPLPPPAAQAVINGRTEREIDLEAQLEEEKRLRKMREVRLSELEDENRQLKTVTPPPRPPAPKKAPLTFFDDED